MGNDLEKTIKQDYEKEKQEAIGAGVRALDSLRAASRYLENASNWGLLDMIGGGLFTTMIKHSKLDDAAQAMETARYDLQNFSKELADIDRRFNLSFSLGDFLELAELIAVCIAGLQSIVEGQLGTVITTGLAVDKQPGAAFSGEVNVG